MNTFISKIFMEVTIIDKMLRGVRQESSQSDKQADTQADSQTHNTQTQVYTQIHKHTNTADSVCFG